MALEVIAAENLMRIISDKDKYCVLSSDNVLLCSTYFSDAKKRQSFCEADNPMKEIKIL